MREEEVGMDDTPSGHETPSEHEPSEHATPREHWMPRQDDRPARDEGDDRLVVVQEEVAVSRREAHLIDRRAGWAAHNWGWLLALGAIAIVFGLVVLSHAFGSVSSLVWLTGLFLVFMGVAQLVTLGRGGPRGAHFAAAAIAIVGGIVLLAWPGETLKVVAFVAGVTVLLWGVVRAFAAFNGPPETRSHDAAVGIALIVLGILMMVWPGATVTLIGVFVGLIAIVWGVVMVLGSLKLRKAGRRWQEMREKSRAAR
jgi:uncharacterized membrane protein HdeD (DUF308 family)